MTTAHLEQRLKRLLGSAERMPHLPRQALIAAAIVLVFLGGLTVGHLCAGVSSEPIEGTSLRMIQAHLYLVANAERRPYHQVERELLDYVGRASTASITYGEFTRAFEWLDTRARRALLAKPLEPTGEHP